MICAMRLGIRTGVKHQMQIGGGGGVRLSGNMATAHFLPFLSFMYLTASAVQYQVCMLVQPVYLLHLCLCFLSFLNMYFSQTGFCSSCISI